MSAAAHPELTLSRVNYRCEPMIERGGDPAFWFLSRAHEYNVGDPAHMHPHRRDVL